MLITLIGPPASGKGTLARTITERMDFTAISTGNYLRRKAETDPEIAHLLSTGALFEDRHLRPIAEKVAFSQDDIILDGYPRTAEQVAFLHICTLQRTRPVHWKVVILEAAETTVRERLATRQADAPRSDDDKLAERLNIYHAELSKIRETLRAIKHNPIEINTDNKDAEAVYCDFIRQLVKHCQQ